MIFLFSLRRVLCPELTNLFNQTSTTTGQWAVERMRILVTWQTCRTNLMRVNISLTVQKSSVMSRIKGIVRLVGYAMIILLKQSNIIYFNQNKSIWIHNKQYQYNDSSTHNQIQQFVIKILILLLLKIIFYLK